MLITAFVQRLFNYMRAYCVKRARRTAIQPMPSGKFRPHQPDLEVGHSQVINKAQNCDYVQRQSGVEKELGHGIEPVIST